MAIDGMAERLNADFDREKYEALIAEARHAGERLLLVKPQGFMNNSGQSVARVVRNRIEDPGHLLVVADDVHLPLGVMRLRPSGSAGGHNGLKSIIEYLGTEEFCRLRIGIGENSPAVGRVDHVLGAFAPDERPEVRRMVGLAVDAILRYVESGIEAAMNEFNGRAAE
jgi:peptidyl-tRNA hydrolase, PTH1 family